MDDASAPPIHTCPACHQIDQADGVVDGKLFKTDHYRTKNESRLIAAVQRAQDRAADHITAFAGSLTFVYMHTAWFAVWIFLNVGAFGAALVFDKFPFGLLTMIVSLEAIFLSTFVMVSQNRQAARDGVRANLDFENNVRSEIWSVHIGVALGIDAEHVEAIVREAVRGAQSELAKPLR
jgi:uncharacterized membrane protein